MNNRHESNKENPKATLIGEPQQHTNQPSIKREATSQRKKSRTTTTLANQKHPARDMINDNNNKEKVDSTVSYGHQASQTYHQLVMKAQTP